MQDKQLLHELLAAETEADALAALEKRDLLKKADQWRYLGNIPNNQSIVHSQQSTAAAAMVEKVTNGIDAILMRRVKAAGIDPRGADAPATMRIAVEKYFGDMSAKPREEIRQIAEDNLVLYATGTKARPAISIYDAGEGQLPQDFPTTFCSLIYGSAQGSYKGAVPFVQGRFNMGGTGVLPFCGDGRQVQLIVSRVPDDLHSDFHEWGYTVFCFFDSKSDPCWKYLVGPDGDILTAGADPIGLLPKRGAKSGELCAPRERKVPSGTLVKMYDYKAPRSNICGELFRKLDDYLLSPVLPMRVIECRKDYSANVMGVQVWDRLGAWGKDKLEEGFEDGASIQIKLSTGETIPGEVRVFKILDKDAPDRGAPQTGLRALVNGQSHAKRDTNFFKTNAIDLEHIAESMLVTLDCSALGQSSRNKIFMSNRETFRDDLLLNELLKQLQKELRSHEGLQMLNEKRYQDKIKNATSDELGISALEDLLSNDPALADLFGSTMPGTVAAKNLAQNPGDKITKMPEEYVGSEFPTYFKRANGATAAQIDLPKDGGARVSFLTDVKNNYFSRSKYAGQVKCIGPIAPNLHLWNGRLTFRFSTPKKLPVGTSLAAKIEITDDAGHGPFPITVEATIVPPVEKIPHEPPQNKPQSQDSPSRPNVVEVHLGADAPPITIEKVPNTGQYQLAVNKDSQLLVDAKKLRPPGEAAAVEFVFKYGLALIAMGLLDAAKKSSAWQTNEDDCRKSIEAHCRGAGKVIVPLCLTLPQKLPKAA